MDTSDVIGHDAGGIEENSQSSDTNDISTNADQGVSAETPYSEAPLENPDQFSREQQRLGHLVQTQSVTVSPTLPPEYLEQYEQICPGTGERILLSSVELAEREQEADIKLRHLRQQIEEESNRARSRRADRAQWMAFVLSFTAILGGLVLIFLDKSTMGLGAIITPTAALIAAFIANQVNARNRSSVSTDMAKQVVDSLTGNLTANPDNNESI